jgi:putative addiction module component (TIGR02574 family)
MSPEAENIIEEALRLPRQARALLAEKLLESLDFEEPFQVSGEWRAEIARRCREIDEGAADLMRGEKVLREAAKELK